MPLGAHQLNSPSREGAAPPSHRGEEPGGAGRRHHGQVLPAARSGQGARSGAAEAPASRAARSPRRSGSRGEHGRRKGGRSDAPAWRPWMTFQRRRRRRMTSMFCARLGGKGAPALQSGKPRGQPIALSGFRVRFQKVDGGLLREQVGLCVGCQRR